MSYIPESPLCMLIGLADWSQNELKNGSRIKASKIHRVLKRINKRRKDHGLVHF